MSTFLLVGGGTLGSVNPLLAFAAALREQHPHVRCVFWGPRSSRDRRVVEESGLPYRSLPAGKLRRYFSLRTLVDIPVIAWAVVVAWVRLRAERPNLVVTAGSYVAVPVAWAAALHRIPVLLYQQDATLGFANRLILRVARVRAATAEGPAHLLPAPVTTVGFALRPDLRAGDAQRAARAYHLDPRRCTVLVIGGSSGARELNERFVAALPHLDPAVQAVHVTGSGKEGTVSRPGYVQIPFTNAGLPDLYALATLVVSRAGSNVLAELIALAKPMVVVPLPGTHQVQNAASLEERGIPVLDQASLTPEHFASVLNDTCHDGQRLETLRRAVAGLWDTDGARALVTLVKPYV